jgi:hypothetical protein
MAFFINKSILKFMGEEILKVPSNPWDEINGLDEAISKTIETLEAGVYNNAVVLEHLAGLLGGAIINTKKRIEIRLSHGESCSEIDRELENYKTQFAELKVRINNLK